MKVIINMKVTAVSFLVHVPVDGPDTPTLTKDSADCVGGGDAVVGQAFQITCASQSLPPATFTWLHNDEAVSSSQSSTGVLSLQITSTDSSGRYVCMAQNSITGGSSQQETDVSVVCESLSETKTWGLSLILTFVL